MKKIFCLFLFVIILIVSFYSCEEKPLNNENNDTEESAVSMNSVQYFGWQQLISDNSYVISTNVMADYSETVKYNIKTGNISSVCLRQNCRHESIVFANDIDYCHIPESSSMRFLVDGKIYYTYDIVSYDEEELELQGSVKPVHTSVFSYYDITTGEYKDILTIKESDYERMFSAIFSDGYIYYLRYIAKTSKPSTKKDYNLALCRMDIEKYNQVILFTDDDVPELSKDTVFFPFAVKNNVVYFANNDTGHMFAVNSDGSGFKYLVDGKDGVIGIFDAYGTFYHDGYIYFNVFVSDMDSTVTAHDALFMYRVNCETGEKQRLTDDYVRWLFVTDQGIYYEMSKAQPTENQSLDAYSGDFTVHTLKYMSHDGSGCSVLGYLNIPYIQIGGVWGVGDSLYFLADYRRDDGDHSIMSGYMIRYNVINNTATEIGKSEELK